MLGWIQILVASTSMAIIVSRRERWIVGFVFFTWTMDAVAITGLGPNIPPFRVIGLLLLPRAARHLTKLLGSERSARALALYILWLAALALVFGYVAPWPDLTGMRSLQQRAEGRAAISMVRQISDMSLMVFLSEVGAKPGMMQAAMRGLVGGLFANAGVALVDFGVSDRLLNHVIEQKLVPIGRQAGLNIEPRAYARACAVGLLFFLLGPDTKRVRIAGGGAAMLGLALSASTSGLVAFVVAAGAGLLWESMRGRLRHAVPLAVGIGLLGVVLGLWWGGSLEENVARRTTALVEGDEGDASDAELEGWLGRLEVFDRAAARFLNANPEYLIVGTGPDLVSIPASQYVTGIGRSIYGNRIDSTPHTGVLAIVASGGLIGLALWILAVVWASADSKRSGKTGAQIAMVVIVVVAYGVLVWTPVVYFVLGFAMAYSRERVVV